MAAEAVAGGATDAANVYLASAITSAPRLFGIPFIANLPAFFAVAMITVILVIGIRESAGTNNAMVLLKIGIILFFCAVGATLINRSTGTTRPRAASRPTASPGSARERRSSSSAISASTPPPPRPRKPATPRATCPSASP
jgi:amino acid transporter